jgi:predicted RNase H-like HicB family nuclease
MTKKIRVNYIWEPEGWSAESPDVPNWSAAAATLEELRQLTVEAMMLDFGSAFRLDEAILPPHVRLKMSGITTWGEIVAVASDRVPELA